MAGHGEWPQGGAGETSPTGGRFTPKLISTLRDSYDAERFRRDVVAGLTVAIVALPLSMALAIASGASPASGLYAAVVGGFLISALGGSRFQIGGPAGAFIVLISGIIDRHGFDGLLTATLMAGAILILMGLLRLGGLIRRVPGPVVVGFTAAIAVIIFASQIRDLLGLTLPGREPAELLHKLETLAVALPSLNPAALTLSLVTIAVIVALRRYAPAWPGLLIAVALATLVTAFLSLPVETIGSRYGGVPSGFPAPALPMLTPERLWLLLPDALAIAFLGGLESLLSATVADGMSGRHHRSDIELVAQGVANIGSATFGGICVTGTIARTATNIRAGAASPVAGILHALFLLAFLLLAAPLASAIPLSALAGVLAVVAWGMADRRAVATMVRKGGLPAAMLLVTFGLTLAVDLMVGIAAGCALGAASWLWRRMGGHAKRTGS